MSAPQTRTHARIGVSVLALLAGFVLAMPATAAEETAQSAQSEAAQSQAGEAGSQQLAAIDRQAIEAVGEKLHEAEKDIASGREESADELVSEAKATLRRVIAETRGDLRARLKSAMDQVDGAEGAIARGDLNAAESRIAAARIPVEDIVGTMGEEAPTQGATGSTGAASDIEGGGTQ